MPEPDQAKAEQYQQLFGNLLGKEMQQMEKENENFDPRGSKAEDIDRLTQSLVDGMIQSQKHDSYDTMINSNVDLKYIVDILLKNPIIIPYMAQFVDVKVKAMEQAINKLMAESFKVEP